MMNRFIRAGIVLASMATFWIMGWYILTGLVYLKEHGILGMEIFISEFVASPTLAFSSLIDADRPEIVKARELFFNPWGQFFFFCILGILLFIVMRSTLKYKIEDDYGAHGTARFAKPREIQRYQKDLKGFLLGEYKGKPVIHPLNHPLRLNSNFLIFGGSGTAKTAGFAIPGILHIAENLRHSMIVTDPKGELYNKTSRYLESLGYNVVCFNLLDESKRRSHRYNPMRNLKRNGLIMTDEVVELADQIIAATGGKGKDQFFTNSARDFLIALMLFLLESRPPEEWHLRNVLHLASTIGKNQEQLRSLFETLPPQSQARAFFDNVDAPGAEKQWEGIRGELRSRLGLWNLQSIANLTAASDFELSQLGKEKTIIYLMIPDSTETYNLIPTIIIDQAFKELIRLADSNPDGRLDIPVWFILDELGNIAPIKDLDVRVNTIRSRGIQLVGIFQNIPQFEDKYGKLGSKSIDSSCDTTIFLGTKNDDTNQAISKALGTTTIRNISFSKKDHGAGVSESYTSRPLMYPEEVRALRDSDELLIIQTGRPPMKLKKHMYFKQKKWQRVLAMETHWSNIEERDYEPLTLFEPNDVEKTEVKLSEEFFNQGA